MEKIRENNIDLLKMICCISVIIIHASARYCTMAVNEGANIYNEGIFFSNLMNCITRFAVPCFVMIAGGFELSKKVSYKEFYNYLVHLSKYQLNTWDLYHILLIL